MSDEVLTSAGIRTRKGHADGTALVTLTIHFIPNSVTRATISIISRISVLRHEIRYHSVEARVPIVSRPCETEKVPYRDRRIGTEQLEANRSMLRNDGGVDR